MNLTRDEKDQSGYYVWNDLEQGRGRRRRWGGRLLHPCGHALEIYDQNTQQKQMKEYLCVCFMYVFSY